MSALIGALRVTLGIDTAAFETGLTNAQVRIASAGAAMQAAGQRMAGVGARITTVMAPIGIAMIAAAREGLNYASSLGEVAQQLGVTTTELQEYRYAASQVGIEQETMDAALARLTRSLGAAANGTGPAAAAFAALGIDVRDASGHIKGAGTIMPEIADALAGIADPAARAASEVAIFGRAGQQLDTLLAGGSGQINALTEAARSLGIVLSSDEIAHADEAADKLAAVKQVLEAKLGSFVAQNADTILAVATGLTSAAETILDAFGRLSPGMQQFALGFAAVATVAGPVLMAVGSLTTMFGGLVTALAPLISVLGLAFESGGVMLLAESAFAAVSAAAGTLIAALAPVLVPIAAIAAAGYLIYENWDKIAPVLSGLGDKFTEVLGPKLTQLFDTVSTALTALWEGPFGEGIRSVIGWLADLGAAYTEWFGDALARILGAAVDIVVGAISLIVDAVQLVVSLLTGDWAGAWNAAKALVGDVINTVLNVLESLVPGAGDAVRRMAAALWSGLSSIASQMVAIGGQIVAGLVNGILAAPEAVWHALQSVVLAGVQRIRDFLGIASPSRLFMEMGGHVTAGLAIGIENGTAAVSGAMDSLAAGVAAGGQRVAAAATTNLVQPLGTMADQVATNFSDLAKSIGDSVKSIIGSIKSGDFIGTLQGVVDILSQVGVFSNGQPTGGAGAPASGTGGLGAVFSQISSAVSSLFTGRASGGPVMANTPYIVGERRAELFVPSTSGRIAPDVGAAGRGGGLNVTVTMDPSTGALGAFVRDQSGQMLAAAAPGLIDAGGKAGMDRMAKMNNRRFG